MSLSGRTPRVLHIFGSMAAGDPQAIRAVRLANAFGTKIRHSFVAADRDLGALGSLSKFVPVEALTGFPAFTGFPTPGRMQALARAMVDYHLVLSYGKAGTFAALSHTTFADHHVLPPLIHHEDGSDETARERRGLRSRWARRVGLGKTAGLVVPTEAMEAVALVDWQQPLGRVKLIRDGVDFAAFAKRGPARGLPRLVKREGENWIGCFTRFEPADGVAELVDALVGLGDDWHLVCVGEGAGQASIAAQAAARGLDHRVHFVADADRREALHAFDIVALPEGREPLPLVAVEAMAAARPIWARPSDELAASISPENAAVLAGGGGLAGAMAELARDPQLRTRIGQANRALAEAERGEAAMIASYRRLYASAMRIDAL